MAGTHSSPRSGGVDSPVCPSTFAHAITSGGHLCLQGLPIPKLLMQLHLWSPPRSTSSLLCPQVSLFPALSGNKYRVLWVPVSAPLHSVLSQTCSLVLSTQPPSQVGNTVPSAHTGNKLPESTICLGSASQPVAEPGLGRWPLKPIPTFGASSEFPHMPVYACVVLSL